MRNRIIKRTVFVFLILCICFLKIFIYGENQKHNSIQVFLPNYKAPNTYEYLGEYLLEDNYIKYVDNNTTVEKFKQKCEIAEDEIIVNNFDNNAEKMDSDIIETGSQVIISTNNTTVVYTAITIGDVNSDGKADIKDILKINKHRLNKNTLTEEYMIAGDVNEDGEVDIRDILKINKYRLNKIETLLPEISPTNIELSSDYIELEINNTSKLEAIIEPKNANNKNIIWTSSDEEIATVDEEGVVTGISAGEAIITAETEDGGLTASANIKVGIAVENISVDKSVMTIDLSEESSFQITATIEPETATDKTITWTSSDEEVAEVNEEGTVTGKKNGTAIITATTANGKEAACEITIETSPTGISLDKTGATLDLSGEKTTKLNITYEPNTANKNTEITWISSDEEVAEVNEEGTVTGKKNGTAIITATTANGKEAACEIKIETYPTGISIDKTNITFDLSTSIQTSKITATIEPETATDKTITWISSDEEVAEVNEEGTVIGKKNGTAIITATTANGKESTCEVTVETSPTGVSLDNISITLDLSGTNTAQLNATITPSDVNVKNNITWVSDDATIAYVSNTGNIIAQKNGNVNITAYTENGKMSICEVTVQTSPTSIYFETNYGDTTKYETVKKGETKTIEAIVKPSTANVNNTVTYSLSGNSKIATVDSSTGLVTATQAGNMTLTAKTANGKKTTVNLNVKIGNTAVSENSLTSTTNDEIYSGPVVAYKNNDTRMVLQSFDIDSTGAIFYAGTNKPGGEPHKSHIYNASSKDTQPTVSGMTFVYNGHEHTIDIEESGNTRYVWHPTFSSSVNSDGAIGSYAVSRMKYTDGQTINFGPGSITEKDSNQNTIKTYNNLTGDNFIYYYKAGSMAKGLQCAIDEDNRLLAIYFKGTGTANFRVYDLDEALALPDEKQSNIPVNVYENPANPTQNNEVISASEYLDFYAKNLGYTTNASGNRVVNIQPLLSMTVNTADVSNLLTDDMQGFDIDGDYLYIIEGNNQPTNITAFDYMYEKNGKKPVLNRTIVKASHTSSFYNVMKGTTTLHTYNEYSFLETEGIKVKNGTVYCGYMSSLKTDDNDTTPALRASIMSIK